VHSTTFAEILEHFGISLLVTTYQAGKLVLLRADRGVVNTHFRSFPKPMGLALASNRLAIGTALEVCEYHNVPAVGAKLAPPGKHDACFLPRRSHSTGEVLIHEMAWARSSFSRSHLRARTDSLDAPARARRCERLNEMELWFVNTRFSCLCTVDPTCSFVPRWRPPFITALAPEDRCHLNGLAVVDGQVRYVTALGETDVAGGWRANKKNGGILMEVPSGRILARGLSMPHSPRWHQGRLWLLESGTGTLGTVDVSPSPSPLPPGEREIMYPSPLVGEGRVRGTYHPIAEMPGFTRGLDFHGNLAVVGLSQVRESAVFSGIPLTERLTERTCGLWVVDVATGRTAAFLKFEDAVQEIFAVQVLPQMCFPDLINDDSNVLANSFVLPDDALGQLPNSMQETGLTLDMASANGSAR
jgi:hypothetical protein